MDAANGTCSSFLLLLLLLLSPLSLTSPSPAQGGHGDGEQERAEEQRRQWPQPVERAIGLGGFASRWDAVRTWAKLTWMSLRQPDLMKSQGRSDTSAGEVLKEAASRSFKASKEAVEHSAESAAKAVHKTKEKAKRTVSKPSAIPDAEL